MNKNNWHRNPYKGLLFAAAFQDKATQILNLIHKGVHVDTQNKYGKTPLMVAAECKNIEAVSILIENGANITLSNQAGETALMRACSKKNNGGVIEKILSVGADINQRDKLGRTALIVASSHCANNVRVLLQLNPDLNIITHDDETALSFAIVWEEKEIVELLIKAGANTNWTDKAGWTLLRYAEETENSEIIDLI